MHKSSSTIKIIWRKWNRWSIGKIARRRWSISSCRHIFALRQKKSRKTIDVFFSSWYFFLCTCVYFNRFGWYGVIVWRYRYHYVPFSFPFAFFYVFFVFFCSPSILLLLWSDDVWWTYINIHTYVFFLYMTRCHSGIYVIHSFEEIILLCVQANHIYTVSLSVGYA